MQAIKALGIGIFLILGFMFVNEMDYQDAIKEEQHYCDMVREGHWPEYKPEIDCKRIDQQHMVRGIKL